MKFCIFFLLSNRVWSLSKTLWMSQGLLNKDALAAVRALLPDYADGDLAAVCSWADEVRFHMRWSSPLHYVDTPDFRCNYKYCSKYIYFLPNVKRCYSVLRILIYVCFKHRGE